MTKWFDTNYHFIVPELVRGQAFHLASLGAVNAYLEARALGIETRPVLVGPVTWLSLAKSPDAGVEPLALLDAVLPVYAELLATLKATGAQWVQIDEPILALDLSEAQRAALRRAYEVLAPVAPRLMLATYFGALGDNTAPLRLPVAGLHVDWCARPASSMRCSRRCPATRCCRSASSTGAMSGVPISMPASA